MAPYQITTLGEKQIKRPVREFDRAETPNRECRKESDMRTDKTLKYEFGDGGDGWPIVDELSCAVEIHVKQLWVARTDDTGIVRLEHD